jgi:hypothetical protein
MFAFLSIDDAVNITNKCGLRTLWSDNTCIYTRFHSVNTQLIWSSGITILLLYKQTTYNLYVMVMYHIIAGIGVKKPFEQFWLVDVTYNKNWKFKKSNRNWMKKYL